MRKKYLFVKNLTSNVGKLPSRVYRSAHRLFKETLNNKIKHESKSTIRIFITY